MELKFCSKPNTDPNPQFESDRNQTLLLVHQSKDFIPCIFRMEEVVIEVEELERKMEVGEVLVAMGEEGEAAAEEGQEEGTADDRCRFL